jgi:hypothetical protein
MYSNAQCIIRVISNHGEEKMITVLNVLVSGAKPIAWRQSYAMVLEV